MFLDPENITIFILEALLIRPLYYNESSRQVIPVSGGSLVRFTMLLMLFGINLPFQLFRFVQSPKLNVESTLVDIFWMVGHVLIDVPLFVTYFHRDELAKFLTVFLHLKRMYTGKKI